MARRAIGSARRGRCSGGREHAPVEADGRTVRLFIGAGRQAGIRPGDLVGAITGEAGVESRSLGAIEIADRFSLIEVPEALADDIIAALKATTIRGKKVRCGGSGRRDTVRLAGTTSRTERSVVVQAFGLPSGMPAAQS